MGLGTFYPQYTMAAAAGYQPRTKVMSLSGALHLVLHVVVPLGVAVTFWRPHWRRAWLIMLATMLVDLDHLVADPIYDPGRCSIGYHPLHTAPAIALYILLLLPRPTRLPALGLVIHMILDGIDCLVMQ
ncbi:hypothetical protein BH23GEM3_BH23GEM3_10450 [soil metagenome]